MSSAQALLIDSGFATWQRRGATFAEDNLAWTVAQTHTKLSQELRIALFVLLQLKREK
jgi:hypothetical protein